MRTVSCLQISVLSIIIGGTLFPHKPTHKATWISLNLQTINQIDHIAITKKCRRVLLEVRVKRGAVINYDQHLLVDEFRMKIAAEKKTDNKVQRRFEIRKLRNTKIRQDLGISLSTGSKHWKREKPLMKSGQDARKQL